MWRLKCRNLALIVVTMGSINAPASSANAQNANSRAVPEAQPMIDFGKLAADVQKCASQGKASCQATLGSMYRDGSFGSKQDFAQARYWAEKSAAQGDPKGEALLGKMYFNGEGGLRQNFALAKTWAEKSAEQGYPEGEFSLGVIYADGHGVQTNYAEAAIWWQKAADRHAGAALRLALFYLKGLGVAKDEKRGADLLLSAVSKPAFDGQPDLAGAAMNLLGGLYEEGRGVAPDREQAEKWFRKAAELGNTDGKENLQRIATRGTSSTARAQPQGDPFTLLTDEERSTIECERAEGDKDNMIRTVVSSYLVLRGVWTLGLDDAKLKDAKRDAEKVIMSTEGMCAVRTLPKTAVVDNIPLNIASQRLLNFGLGKQIVRDAERYFPDEFHRAASFGIAGLQGDIAKAFMAREAVGGRAIAGIGNERFAYYECLVFASQDVCMTPSMNKLFNKYEAF